MHPGGCVIAWNSLFLRSRLTGAVDRTTPMTPEIYTILAVAIALAGLILNGQRAIGELRRDLNALSDRVHGDIAALGQRVSRVEGLLEGIRDSIRERAA